MALIKCEECGKEISDKAITCPNCGARKKTKPLTKEEKIFSIIITLVICASIVGICFSPELVKVSYPDYRTYNTYNYDGVVGYTSSGEEIRGTTSTPHYYFGEQKVDYSLVIITDIICILVPTVMIIIFVKRTNRKKYEKKS